MFEEQGQVYCSSDMSSVSRKDLKGGEMAQIDSLLSTKTNRNSR